MVDPEIQRLRAKLQDKLRSSRFIPETKARTGRLSSNTVVNPDPKVYDVNGNIVTNKTWVRIGATQSTPAGRSTVPVWNFTVKTIRADAPVILVEDDNGDLYIDRADAQAADTSGIPSSFFAPDAPPPELSEAVIPVANIFDLMPYRGAALVLRARAGWLPNGTYWNDDAVDGALDVSTEITATSGQTAYVVAGINLATNTWTVTTSADRGFLLAPGSFTDIESVLAAWVNVFPIAAIPLANGATDFANVDIIDLRTWGSGGQGLNVDYEIDNITQPPTEANLVTTFGAPALLTAGGVLGVVNDNDAGDSLYITAPTATDWWYAALARSLRAPTANLVFEGDSLTRGHTATAGQEYVPQFDALLIADGKTYALQHLATNGDTMANMASSTAAFDAEYDATKDVNIALLWAGTNDLYLTSDSAATVYGNMTSWISGRQSAGFRVIVSTVLPRTQVSTPGDFESRRLSLNALILANSAGADVVVDIAADPRLDDSTDGTYFNADEVHLTDAGYGAAAEVVADAVILMMDEEAGGLPALGRLTCFEDTKAKVEAAAGILQEIRFARATDTDELGVYIDGDWHWFGGATVDGHVIRDNGSAETQRAALNFLSGTGIIAAATDDAGNDETEVTHSLNLSGLTEDTNPDSTADFVATYDASATGHKKVRLDRLPTSIRAVFIQTEDATVANTTTETTLLAGGQGSKTLPANALAVGATLRIMLGGYISDTGNPTINIKIYLGGVEICATGADTISTSVSEVDFHMEALITCRSVGATGTVVASGLFEHDDGVSFGLTKTTATTVDTTSALDINVTATWGTADPADTLTTQIATIELMTPMAISTADELLLESGDALLLESGDALLLED